MRKTTITLLALCALAALAGRADEADPPDAKAELKKLQGTWRVPRQVRGGRELKSKLPPPLTYTFDGDKLVTTNTFFTRDRLVEKQAYKVKIDTKKEPHTIDLVPDGKGFGMAGIYKIEKGELYLARGRPVFGKGAPAMPKDFKGEGVLVNVMKRQKEKAKE